MRQQFFQHEIARFNTTFYDTENRSLRIDPAIVRFTVKLPDGTVVEEAVSPDGGLGRFRAETVLEQAGKYFWRWETDGPRIVKEGSIAVLGRNVD